MLYFPFFQVLPTKLQFVCESWLSVEITLWLKEAQCVRRFVTISVTDQIDSIRSRVAQSWEAPRIMKIT